MFIWVVSTASFAARLAAGRHILFDLLRFIGRKVDATLDGNVARGLEGGCQGQKGDKMKSSILHTVLLLKMG